MTDHWIVSTVTHSARGRMIVFRGPAANEAEALVKAKGGAPAAWSGYLARLNPVMTPRPKIPAELTRYPSGCPDPDWCTGNGVCHWRCNEVEDDYV